MKRAKLIMVALCTIFAAMLVAGCQNPVNGSNGQGTTQQGSGSGSGSGSGTTASTLAPFAGTTWGAEGVDDLVFNANGTIVYTGENCTYQVVQNGSGYTAKIIMSGTEMARLAVASADATSAELTVYPFVNSPAVYTKR